MCRSRYRLTHLPLDCGLSSLHPGACIGLHLWSLPSLRSCQQCRPSCQQCPYQKLQAQLYSRCRLGHQALTHLPLGCGLSKQHPGVCTAPLL